MGGLKLGDEMKDGIEQHYKLAVAVVLCLIV